MFAARRASERRVTSSHSPCVSTCDCRNECRTPPDRSRLGLIPICRSGWRDLVEVVPFVVRKCDLTTKGAEVMKFRCDGFCAEARAAIGSLRAGASDSGEFRSLVELAGTARWTSSPSW